MSNGCNSNNNPCPALPEESPRKKKNGNGGRSFNATTTIKLIRDLYKKIVNTFRYLRDLPDILIAPMRRQAVERVYKVDIQSSPYNTENEKTMGQSVLSNLPLSRAEKAILEGRNVNLYIPKEGYEQEAIYGLRLFLDSLKWRGKDPSTVKYRIVVGEAPGREGEVDKEGRVIIQFCGYSHF